MTPPTNYTLDSLYKALYHQQTYKWILDQKYSNSRRPWSRERTVKMQELEESIEELKRKILEKNQNTN